MTWDESAFELQLTHAVDAFDRVVVHQHIEALISHLRTCPELYPESRAKKILEQLRRGRFFAELEQIADQLMQTGHDAFWVKLQYAQSLIDQDRLMAAERFLLPLSEELKDHEFKHEISGLLGRAYKQMYLNLRYSGNPRSSVLLGLAFNYYYGAYRDRPESNLWHGINAVALGIHASDVGVHLGGVEPNQLAQEILSTVARRRRDQTLTAWDEATAAEACIALERYDEAIKWVFNLVSHREISAFHLGSFERQLRAVWGLTPTDVPGKYLLGMVQGELLNREGGRVDVDQHEVGQSSNGNGYLQRILGDVGAKTYQWMQKAIEQGRSVARISLLDGRPVGTGFVVRGRDLNPGWNGAVLVTNAHVISPGSAQFPKPEDVIVAFDSIRDGENRPLTITIGPPDVLWSSPPGRLSEADLRYLDVTLVRLDTPIDAAQSTTVHGTVPHLGSGERVYVIGHPQGRDLSFSIQDNRLLDYQDPLIHYHTPTEPGSSGSPLFDELWRVIGIHHAGSDQSPRLHGRSGFYPANEGISIQAVCKAVNHVSWK